MSENRFNNNWRCVGFYGRGEGWELNMRGDEDKISTVLQDPAIREKLGVTKMCGEL